MSIVRVRFAPSPTGFLHLGGLRTALYDYLFARHNGGSLILRIEDTDQNRKVEGAVENLIAAFSRLGIEFDEGPGLGGNFGPYVQSRRLDIYSKYAHKLMERGFAYRCFCSAETLELMRKEQQGQKQFPKYNRRCLTLTEEEVNQRLEQGLKYVIRLKMPDDRTFEVHDQIRGKVEIDVSQLDDQVLIKSDGYPTYHLAAVVDDHLMRISHVIRGEEWLPSTPKHVYLYECLGWQTPVWVHLPLILNPDKSKLSKRMNDVSVDSYLQKGYLKEALINFVALLGWHGADDRELYSLLELCREFTLERVNKAGAVFDLTKLDWMNGQYIRNLPLEQIAALCKPDFTQAGIDSGDQDKFHKVIELVRKRVTLSKEIVQQSVRYYVDQQISGQDLETLKKESSQRVISWFLNELNALREISGTDLQAIISKGKELLEMSAKEYFAPLNIALSFSRSCPELHGIIDILGLDETRRRLRLAENVITQE